MIDKFSKSIQVNPPEDERTFAQEEIHWENGLRSWHRADGPAVIATSPPGSFRDKELTSEYWINSGMYHRNDGPAITEEREWDKPRTEWCFFGRRWEDPPENPTPEQIQEKFDEHKKMFLEQTLSKLTNLNLLPDLMKMLHELLPDSPQKDAAAIICDIIAQSGL